MEISYERLQRQIRFVLEIDKMKSVYRKNILVDKSRNETDAEHSWHMAVCAMLLAEYAPEGTDISHALRLCVCHDLIEVYAGDTFAFDAAANVGKLEREKKAADELFAILPDDQRAEFRAYWDEFEEGKTKESLFANAMDRFQPFMLNLSTGGHTWKLCDATRAMVEKRLHPVKVAMPSIWPFIEEELDRYEERGYIAHNPKE
ncbi:MAG: HD domain-containing protein [Clostridia bacterium]|nr:HD domain-containing protein [Clostridia bacterium]